MNAQKPTTIYEHADEVTALSSVVDLVKLSDQYRQSAILHFAVAQHLFDQTTRPATADAISQQLGWVPNKAKIFLNGLVALGLLKKSADTYTNQPLAERFLVSRSAEFIGPIIAHQRLQWQNWPRLGEILSSAESMDFQQENRFKHDIAARDAFNDAMVRFSQPMVDVLKELPVFDTASKVIDLAGGHGTYIAEIARRHPQVQGEIWDLAATRQSAESTVEKYQLAGRLTFKERNLLDLARYEGESADVIMVNDCLHYFTREETSTLIRSAAQLVNDGGSLLVLSMTLEDDEIHPALSADFSLHMMVNTVHGELHPTRWIAEQMVAQGFEVVQEPIGRYSLLIGRRTEGRVA
ncbi:methyltransferase [Pseudomonas marginalis]|jgi:ubiquinone/menaquinone biosynthesis C-methylase UbiE|uniref:class I SAM-dependent methyltransferase n=1 Tax=Pseudomonas TaxID=286 RepID=UPI000812AC26|nr:MULTISPECIES: class I SAM-dependent methyltransferase [unclassified Pseudomonas]MDT9633651.1 methyltransferase domain-containing protein [Pseudomonas sp. JV449]TKJ71286.1 methyltransferase domain-containing protein [Pseudomonas sp. CFBP13509]CRM75740.1 Multifunctional cyclase-dehydratase-3-O-methyl transferase TcmN [Pseudomonas sp. 8 R 14]SAM34077.1 Multifunctional cyclase-dehydratase-3-O-methyl transferase TcmN [Pseudomonas sp. 1 R 17]SFS24609.1 Dimerisation domain-containing protein [Pseu